MIKIQIGQINDGRRVGAEQQRRHLPRGRRGHAVGAAVRVLEAGAYICLFVCLFLRPLGFLAAGKRRLAAPAEASLLKIPNRRNESSQTNRRKRIVAKMNRRRRCTRTWRRRRRFGWRSTTWTDCGEGKKKRKCEKI